MAPRLLPLAAIREAERREHQRQLIQSAVDLVVGGSSARVVLVGLRPISVVLPLAQELAEAGGVVARALWQAHGCQIAIEPNG